MAQVSLLGLMETWSRTLSQILEALMWGPTSMVLWELSSKRVAFLLILKRFTRTPNFKNFALSGDGTVDSYWILSSWFRFFWHTKLELKIYFNTSKNLPECNVESFVTIVSYQNFFLPYSLAWAQDIQIDKQKYQVQAWCWGVHISLTIISV